MRLAAFSLLVLLAPAAGAVDNTRVIKLEQDVRGVERTVQDLARQIAELRLQLSLAGSQPGRAPPQAVRAAGWLEGDNWKHITPGMDEKQVTALLGAPTSSRDDAGARSLFYAMELSPAGLLGGRVVLRGGQVVEVHPPALR